MAGLSLGGSLGLPQRSSDRITFTFMQLFKLLILKLQFFRNGSKDLSNFQMLQRRTTSCNQSVTNEKLMDFCFVKLEPSTPLIQRFKWMYVYI